MRNEKLLIVTDLDATLLTKDYKWNDAAATILRLQSLGFPIVFNSSKTHLEMMNLSLEMGNLAPIVGENGGTLAIPAGWPQGPEREADYSIEVKGIQRRRICLVAHKLRKQEGYEFEGFSDWSVEELRARTGLSPEQAQHAQTRYSTEPILWTESEARWSEFERSLSAENIRILRGGRFRHLMGQHDKADGLVHVRELYERELPEIRWTTIALGDSPNDLRMLEAADIAVVIPTEHGPILKPKSKNLVVAKSPGPVGWAHSMEKILEDWLANRKDPSENRS